MLIRYNDQDIEMNDQHSLQDYTFTNTLINIPDNVNVYGACFACEMPDTVLFRANMTGVTFYNCNLDNVLIPAGNTVIGGSQRKFRVQNDLNDWELDAQGEPVKPLGAKIFDKFGLPVPSPADIPTDKAVARVDLMVVAKELKVSGAVFPDLGVIE